MDQVEQEEVNQTDKIRNYSYIFFKSPFDLIGLSIFFINFWLMVGLNNAAENGEIRLEIKYWASYRNEKKAVLK